MKVEELRKLDRNELIQKCNESVSEVKKLKFALKSGNITAEIINKARSLKKEIAKIKTVLSEMELVSKA